MNLTYFPLFLSINHNPGRSHYSRPFDSAFGIPDKPALILLSIFAIIALYIGIRVYISLRNDRNIKK